MKKSNYSALSTVIVGDVAAAAIHALLHSIRSYALNLRTENMETARKYYDTTVSEWLKSPADLGLVFQTVQSEGVHPSSSDAFLTGFMAQVACVVSGSNVRASIHSPSPSRTSVRFESGVIKMESAEAVTMRKTVPLNAIDHPVIFTALGWGAYVIQNLTVSAQCCQSSNRVAQFIRKHARLLTSASAPETWFMREEEHVSFWSDLRALFRLLETTEGTELLRKHIGELNGRHAYPDIHGFVNEQTILLDVTDRDGDLCVARHKRADGAYVTGNFPELTSVVASWVTFCMCDPLVFLSAFAQIHAPLYEESGEWVDPETPLSEVGYPLCDEWELPESYSIRHAAS